MECKKQPCHLFMIRYLPHLLYKTPMFFSSKRYHINSSSQKPELAISMHLVLHFSFQETVTKTYLSFTGFRKIRARTISTIIPETCVAIYDVLKSEYLKVQ